MREIEAYAEVVGLCPDGLIDSMKFIEKIARVCYKSEEKITDTSAKPFLKKTIVGPGHTAMLEHSCRAIVFERRSDEKIEDTLPASLLMDPWIYIDQEEDDVVYVVATYRAWMNYFINHSEGFFTDDHWDVFTSIDERIEDLDHGYNLLSSFVLNADLPRRLQFVTVKFKVGRDVSHELVRHRRLVGIAQESQRYVGYSGDHIEFVIPEWANSKMMDIYKTIDAYTQWKIACIDCEHHYNELISEGLKRQDARVVLNNSTATEIYLTAPGFQWDWIRELRTSLAAYPQMRTVMTQVGVGIDSLIGEKE